MTGAGPGLRPRTLCREPSLSAQPCRRGMPRAVLPDPGRLRVRWLRNLCTLLRQEDARLTKGLESWEAPQRRSDSWTRSQGRGLVFPILLFSSISLH